MTQRVALLNCNAGGAFGLGHLARTIALCEEALARGWQVHIAGEFDARAKSFLQATIPGMPIRSVSVADMHGLSELAARISPDVVHLDTYWMDQAGVPTGVLVSNMQDGEYGERAARLIIDANLGASSRLATFGSNSASFILGTQGTLIRSQVRRQRDRERSPSERPRILVVLGGTDPRGLTSSVVNQLVTLKQPTKITVVNSGRPFTVDAANAAHQLEFVSFVPDLPALAREHDLVVTASGTSTWDFACIGLPMALICVADNQQAGYRAAIESGLAIALGDLVSSRKLTGLESLAAAIDRPEVLMSLADRGRELVDGLGAWRIVASWESILGAPRRDPDPAINVRPATRADSEQLLLWRNDPTTRSGFRSGAVVARDEHLSWLNATLADPSRRLLVAEVDGKPIGTARWDRTSIDSWEVSLTVAPDFRGRGFATSIVLAAEAAIASTAATQLVAVIRSENSASKRSFARAGYLPDLPDMGTGYERYRKWLPPLR